MCNPKPEGGAILPRRLILPSGGGSRGETVCLICHPHPIRFLPFREWQKRGRLCVSSATPNLSFKRVGFSPIDMDEDIIEAMELTIAELTRRVEDLESRLISVAQALDPRRPILTNQQTLDSFK